MKEKIENNNPEKKTKILDPSITEIVLLVLGFAFLLLTAILFKFDLTIHAMISLSMTVFSFTLAKVLDYLNKIKNLAGFKDLKHLKDLADFQDFKHLKNLAAIQGSKEVKDLAAIQDSKEVKGLETKGFKKVKAMEDFQDLKDFRELTDFRDLKGFKELEDFQDLNDKIQKTD